MQYQIVKVYGCVEENDISYLLEQEVNENIKKGWKPINNIAIIPFKPNSEYKDGTYIEAWQAMIKEDNDL